MYMCPIEEGATLKKHSHPLLESCNINLFNFNHGFIETSRDWIHTLAEGDMNNLQNGNTQSNSNQFHKPELVVVQSRSRRSQFCRQFIYIL